MKIQIIGLGLIGGSLCKTIRKRTDHIVLGMDLDEQAVRKAIECNAIHREGSVETLKEADLVIVCLYPEKTISFLLEHREDFGKGSVVADVCGIKEAVVARFSQLCEERGLNNNSLANVAGVTPSTVYSMMDPTRHDVSVVTVKKLCDGLDLSISDFFDDPIFRNLDQEIQ